MMCLCRRWMGRWLTKYKDHSRMPKVICNRSVDRSRSNSQTTNLLQSYNASVMKVQHLHLMLKERRNQFTKVCWSKSLVEVQKEDSCRRELILFRTEICMKTKLIITKTNQFQTHLNVSTYWITMFKNTPTTIRQRT